MDNWSVYLLCCCDNKRTYIGASNNPERRLKCHNGLLSGGAKATFKYRPWKHICIISGLNKIQALQLEWRLKKWVSPKCGKLKTCPGINNRIKNIFVVLNLEQWTSNSVGSNKLPLHIKWFFSNDIITTNLETLPAHITYDFQ